MHCLSKSLFQRNLLQLRMNFLKNASGAIMSAFTSSGLEMPAHNVVSKPHEEVEERSYPETFWVSTKVKAMSQREAGREGFWRLFNYIQGKNEAGKTIPMTAPVATKIEPGEGPNCESTFTISFYIGQDYRTAPDPPKPTHPEVYTETWQPMTVYTRTFGGFADDDKWISHAANLGEQMDNAGAKIHKDYYFCAGYDSPFKMFNRRNEVWFVKHES